MRNGLVVVRLINPEHRTETRILFTEPLAFILLCFQALLKIVPRTLNGKIVDPFGHEWGINQQVKEQSHEETQRAADEFFTKRK